MASSLLEETSGGAVRCTTSDTGISLAIPGRLVSIATPITTTVSVRALLVIAVPPLVREATRAVENWHRSQMGVHCVHSDPLTQRHGTPARLERGRRDGDQIG